MINTFMGFNDYTLLDETSNPITGFYLQPIAPILAIARTMRKLYYTLPYNA
jgi:hypothetical protein